MFLETMRMEATFRDRYTKVKDRTENEGETYLKVRKENELRRYCKALNMKWMWKTHMYQSVTAFFVVSLSGPEEATGMKMKSETAIRREAEQRPG